jgi:hypothetical protein
MKTDENNPHDWLRSGETRLKSADQLAQIEGVTESAIELLSPLPPIAPEPLLAHRSRSGG